jgi:hypothetical protein
MRFFLTSETIRRSLRVTVALLLLGAALAERTVLCIEADGQSHIELLSEICCPALEGSAHSSANSILGGQGRDAEVLADASCGDCRDFLVTSVLQGKPANRTTILPPAASPSEPLPISSLLPAPLLLSTAREPSVAPVLLSLRTIILSC